MTDFIYISKWQMVDEYPKSAITYSKKNNNAYVWKQNYQRTYKATKQ